MQTLEPSAKPRAVRVLRHDLGFMFFAVLTIALARQPAFLKDFLEPVFFYPGVTLSQLRPVSAPTAFLWRR